MKEAKITDRQLCEIEIKLVTESPLGFFKEAPKERTVYPKNKLYTYEEYIDYFKERFGAYFIGRNATPLNRYFHEEIEIQPKNKVLYFPYINVPKSNWFAQVLFYWDEVGAIVPRDFIYDPEKLHPYMRTLVKERLVKQIIPEIYRLKAGNRFSEEFIKLIEKNDINNKFKTIKWEQVPKSRIHFEKFGDEISRYLIDENLAKKENYPWFQVESTTANLFMTYLASFLGNSDEISMQPITDDISSLATFMEDYGTSYSPEKENTNEMRNNILTDILPVPEKIPDVIEILKFKEDYGDLLPRFRKIIENKLAEISFIESEAERNWELNQFKENSKQDIEELIIRMKERNWGRILFGTMCGLGAAAIPGAKAIVQNDWATGAEAIPGILGAVYSAYDGFKDKQKEIVKSPLAYAAFLNKNIN